MTNQLTTTHNPSAAGQIIRQHLAASASRSAGLRVTAFVQQQAEAGAGPVPDLAAYAQHLQQRGLAPASIAAHLNTIRGAYRRGVLKSNALRTAWYEAAGGFSVEAAAGLSELLTRIENALDVTPAAARVVTVQDEDGRAGLRLTRGQVEALLEAAAAQPALLGLRDVALISLALATGLREAELVALEVGDLRARTADGELAVIVRAGKDTKGGAGKQRLVPYGDMSAALAAVERWLTAAGIAEGPVFRGLHKGNRRARPGALTWRSVNKLLERYPVMVEGEAVTVKPHDLRRSYARLMFEAGVDIHHLAQNLGHSSIETTRGYIGTTEGRARRARRLFAVPQVGYQQAMEGVRA